MYSPKLARLLQGFAAGAPLVTPGATIWQKARSAGALRLPSLLGSGPLLA